MTKTVPGRPSDLTSYTGALLVTVTIAFLRLGPDGLSASFSLGHLGLLLWCCHFCRRIVECLFVHRYAGRRVPLGDAIGEYAYYWGFGAWTAWASASKSATPLDVVSVIGLLLFVSGELGNAWAHLKLRALRRPNTNDRAIPRGGLFQWVSCANYSYEILAWTGFAVTMRTLPSWVFLVAVTPILASWAKKRHARYHELFDGKDGRMLYPPQRRALLPWVFIVL